MQPGRVRRLPVVSLTFPVVREGFRVHKEAHRPGPSQQLQRQGEKSAGRPWRDLSSRPARRSSKNRLRHLLTICRGVSSLSAISSFSRPLEAYKTIRARITSLYGDVYFRAMAFRRVLSIGVNCMIYGLFLGIFSSFSLRKSMPKYLRGYQKIRHRIYGLEY